VTRVSSRARLREDRAGDPLDGLVNLFDLGIVLAVAFLLAALSSLDVSPTTLQRDAVVARPGEQARELRVQPGERVVGRGERLGTVYRLEDGRTVLVRPAPRPGAAPPTPQGAPR
jgi:hypothetical protein